MTENRKRNTSTADISPLANRFLQQRQEKRSKLADQLGEIDVTALLKDEAIPAYARAIMEQMTGLIKSAVELLQVPSAQECIEEDRRQHEVVVALLHESNEHLPSQRVQHDKRQVIKMLDILTMEIEPTAVYRMGKPPTADNPKPRLLKVQLPTRAAATRFIRSAHKLKSEFPAVRVRESKSAEERKQYRLLVDTCNKKRAETGKDMVIYRGVIIERKDIGKNNN